MKKQVRRLETPTRIGCQYFGCGRPADLCEEAHSYTNGSGRTSFYYYCDACANEQAKVATAKLYSAKRLGRQKQSVKLYAFYFHFNKPASQQAGRAQASVHYRGACHIVDTVDCQVPVKSRTNKRQPHFVMAGRCSELLIENGTAILR